METNRIKKTIAIILAILFLVSLTASAVSALNSQTEPPTTKITVVPHPTIHTSSIAVSAKSPWIIHVNDENSQITNMETYVHRGLEN
jgi:hypothetical protein